jgi:isocitrate lyase
VADAEAGFGGVLNAFELMKAMIEAGAAGVHFEDQLAAAKKCGHMGVLMITPAMRVVVAAIGYLLEGDWVYALVSFGVIVVLTASLLIGAV